MNNFVEIQEIQVDSMFGEMGEAIKSKELSSPFWEWFTYGRERTSSDGFYFVEAKVIYYTQTIIINLNEISTYEPASGTYISECRTNISEWSGNLSYGPNCKGVAKIIMNNRKEYQLSKSSNDLILKRIRG